MTNRYSMTLEDNIFWAKRNVVDSIWKEANIEGIGVTFPETKEIFEGRVVAGLSVDETIAINNLKHAWHFVFENITAPVDLAFVRQVNHLVGQGIIADPGNLRNFDVSIGGTSWKPELPDYDKATNMIRTLYASKESGELKALRMFASLCRAQLFSDGNKRTAQIICNKIMIENGAGIMAIPVEAKQKFEELLIGYYETNDPDAMLAFLSTTSISGYDSPSLLSSEQGRSRHLVEDAPICSVEKSYSPQAALDAARSITATPPGNNGRARGIGVTRK